MKGMKSRHTPGPFEIAGEGPCVATVRRGRHDDILITAPLRSSMEPQTGAIADANAHLFKAAPQMLLALESTLNYWESVGFATCEPGCDCIVEDVRAAIAAAKGGAA